MQIIIQQSRNSPHITRMIPDSSPVTPVLRNINPVHCPCSEAHQPSALPLFWGTSTQCTAPCSEAHQPSVLPPVLRHINPVHVPCSEAHQPSALPLFWGTSTQCTALVLRHINPVHVSTSHYFNIHISNVLPSTPGSSKWALSFSFPHQPPYTFPFCCTPATCPDPGTHRAAPPVPSSSLPNSLFHSTPYSKGHKKQLHNPFNPRPFMKRKTSSSWHHQTCARASTAPFRVTDSADTWCHCCPPKYVLFNFLQLQIIRLMGKRLRWDRH